MTTDAKANAKKNGWGGPRRGAGRPPVAPELRRGHIPRPEVSWRSPVHITMQLADDAPRLRGETAFRTLHAAFVLGKERPGFRLVGFAVHGDTLHLLCEAKDRVGLSRALQGLSIRIARQLNRALARAGRLFDGRYRAHVLRTPAEARAALAALFERAPQTYSSAADFDGWRTPPPTGWKRPAGESPVVAAASALLTSGWRKLGLLAVDG